MFNSSSVCVQKIIYDPPPLIPVLETLHQRLWKPKFEKDLKTFRVYNQILKLARLSDRKYYVP